MLTVNVERMTYEEIVEKAKAVLKKRGHYGTDDVDLYACDLWLNGNQINLWAYWQGYQIEDIDKGIDIMLVGQDWGNPEWDKDVAARIARIQEGEQVSYFGGKLSPTDKNLIELFKVMGCDIESLNPGKRILFTNYCLGYRSGKQSHGMTPNLLNMDKELFHDLVKALRPKAIICLGKITYEAVTGEKPKEFTKQLKDGIPFVSDCLDVTGTKIYGVSHCGGLGLKNIGGIENAKRAWRTIGIAL